MQIFDEAEVSKAIAVAIRAAAPDAIVYDYWVEGFEVGDWPAIARLPEGIAHGYIITRRGITQVMATGMAVNQAHEFAIVGFYNYSQGSERVWAAEVDAIAAALRPPKLTLEDGCELRTAGIQWLIDLFPFGNGELMHLGRGTLEVTFRLC